MYPLHFQLAHIFINNQIFAHRSFDMYKTKTSKINIFEVFKGTDRIRTGDDGVADRSLTAWLPRHIHLPVAEVL